jgi:hypothetical protein
MGMPVIGSMAPGAPGTLPGGVGTPGRFAAGLVTLDGSVLVPGVEIGGSSGTALGVVDGGGVDTGGGVDEPGGGVDDDGGGVEIGGLVDVGGGCVPGGCWVPGGWYGFCGPGGCAAPNLFSYSLR